MTTLREAIQARGLKDPKTLTVKQARAAQARRSAGTYNFPHVKDLQHRLLVEAQGPLLTVNDDGEFSSRGLTDWYVAEFIKRNHLRSH